MSDHDDKIKTQLQIALEALRFYASADSYGQGESFGELSRINDDDLEYLPSNRGHDTVGGKRARRALLEIADVDGSQRLLKDRENSLNKK
jgi:hypothetical protein